MFLLRLGQHCNGGLLSRQSLPVIRFWVGRLRLDRARRSSSAVPFAPVASGWRACAGGSGDDFDFPGPCLLVALAGFSLSVSAYFAVPAVRTRLEHCFAVPASEEYREREREYMMGRGHPKPRGGYRCGVWVSGDKVRQPAPPSSVWLQRVRLCAGTSSRVRTHGHTALAQSIGARAPRPGHPETIDGTHAHAFEKHWARLKTQAKCRGESPAPFHGSPRSGPLKLLSMW